MPVSEAFVHYISNVGNKFHSWNNSNDASVKKVLLLFQSPGSNENFEHHMITGLPGRSV